MTAVSKPVVTVYGTFSLIVPQPVVPSSTLGKVRASVLGALSSPAIKHGF